MLDDKKEQALQLLQEGVAPAEVARQLELSPATVRTWKSRLKKQGETKRNVSGVSKKVKRETLAKMVAAADENTDLTEQQKRFCLLYAQRPNATRAYRLAFECKAYGTAKVEGCRLRTKPNVRAEIKRQKEIVMQQMMADPTDIFRLYWDMAFADLSDFVEWGRAEVQVMSTYGPVMIDDPENPDGEKIPLTKTVNEVRFLESTEVDGTLLTEVKQGKDGAGVKLADRMKALAWLSDYFEMNPADKHRREFDKKRLTLEEARAGKADGDLGDIIFEVVAAGIDAKTEEDGVETKT